MSGTRIVIVVYRPLEGKEAELRALLRKHVRVLREQGLATDRPPIFLQARDGSYVEIFEWTSRAAIEAAHENAAVGALWAEFAAACEYRKLADLGEAADLFAEFALLDGDAE